MHFIKCRVVLCRKDMIFDYYKHNFVEIAEPTLNNCAIKAYDNDVLVCINVLKH